MGELHNEIRQGTLSVAATRALGVTRLGGIERFSETITPVLNLWGMPEWAYLRGESLAAWSRFVAAGGAATFAGAFLCNPLANKLLVVVEALSGVPATTQLQLVMALDADVSGVYGSSSFGALRDRRPVGRFPTVSTAIIRYGTPAALPTSQIIEHQQSAAATTKAFLSVPIVLPPGTAVGVHDPVANEQLFANFTWRERPPYPGELI